MTAPTPNPADSGAAASRDAARTARRLTDGTLPRTSPPPAGRSATAGTMEGGPVTNRSEGAGLMTAGPVEAGPTTAGPATAGSVEAGPVAIRPVEAGALTTVEAPVTPSPADRVLADLAPSDLAPAAPLRTPPEERPAPAPVSGTGPTPVSGTAPGPVPATAAAPGPDAVSVVPEHPRTETAPAPSPEAAKETATAPAAEEIPVVEEAPPPEEVPAAEETPVTEEAPATEEGPAAQGPEESPPPSPPQAVASAPAVEDRPAPTGKPDVPASPADERAPASEAPATTPESSVPESSVPESSVPKDLAPPKDLVTPESPAPGILASEAPAPGAPATPATPEPPASEAAPPPVPPASPASPAPPVSPTSRPPAAPDFARIRGAKVATVAVPVAGVVRVARRRNVIGTDTTGSIPVHLLFRDEPGAAARTAADGGGGPDTVAMAAPTSVRKDRAPAAPGPSGPRVPGRTEQAPEPRPRTKARSKARHAAPLLSTRPAPTADPSLVERPATALPGWVGLTAGALALLWCAAVVWWTGAVPTGAARALGLPDRPYLGVRLGHWFFLGMGLAAALLAFGGLGRGRVGHAWVLTLFGDYRGTVRRTGLVWVGPLLLRRRVDVRLRHWRSEPLPAVDAKGTALDVVVLVVWRVRDTARAALGVEGHEQYLREQVEAAVARVLSQLPADAFHEDAPTLRDAEAVGEALTRMLSAECAPVGLDVFSAQPTRIEYAPELAAAMRRRRIAALDAKHRDSILTSVVDAVDDVVHRLTSRGLVELDDYERKVLVKDLTVAFYTGRTAPAEGA